MSTRSGKRIHNSTFEEVNVDVVSMPRRKTRTYKQKDNCENTETLSKKKHYVRYPSEEESIADSQLQISKSKKLHRSTLQEINCLVSNDSEVDPKPIRSTRRTKKIEEAVSSSDIVAELKKKVKKKKKNLKKDSTSHDEDTNREEIAIGKTKGSKKKNKKQSTSMVVEEETDNRLLDKSITSIDSFHSAAGSTIESPIGNEQQLDTLISKKSFPTISVSIDDVIYNKGSKKSDTSSKDLKKISSAQPNGDESNTNNHGETTVTNIGKKTQKQNTRKRSLSVPMYGDVSKENGNNKISSVKKGTKQKSKQSKENDIETVLNSTFDKENCDSHTKNSTIDKTTENVHDTTYNKESGPVEQNKERSSIASYDLSMSTIQKCSSPNSTYDKSIVLKNNEEKVLNTTFEKQSMSVNSTFETDKKSHIKKAIECPKASLKLDNDKKDSPKLNSTFDKTNEISNLDSTYDKISGDSKKSSLMSSDRSNITDDKSNDSRISITSDESKENIVNTTPVLIESSIDESVIFEKDISIDKEEKSPLADKSISKDKSPHTPLKREGTFTKESSSPHASLHKTPSKRTSVSSPGCTPFPASKSSSKDKVLLNVTRSIEKSRRSSILHLPRATKVMFCSPANNTIMASQMKGKIIKSNLKGSNKSFVFNESESDMIPSARKRSYTLSDADEVSVKRKRLAEDLQNSVDRLSRPRTTSASGKLQDQSTPSKPAQNGKEAKVGRTKLPNFAAVHQKQFSKMESLDECQQRKAQRARDLLAARNVGAERKSPRDKDTTSRDARKEETPVKSKLPTLESLNPGYTRFGFKMNSDLNPFTNTKNVFKSTKHNLNSTQSDFRSTKSGLNSTKTILNSTKTDFNSTKTDLNSTKTIFNSTKIDFNSTKTDFNSTKNGVNSFRISTKPPSNGIKTTIKCKETKLNGLKRQPTLPSLAGSTARKEMAKQTIMREKSFTEKRNESRKENRTIIKGVRTNRRFELQMKSRNIN